MGNANAAIPNQVLGGSQLSRPGHSTVCVVDFLPPASEVTAPLASTRLELMSLSSEITHKPRKLEALPYCLLVV